MTNNGLFNLGLLMNKFKPIECPYHKGRYLYPGVSNYCIDADANLLSHHTGQFMKPLLRKSNPGHHKLTDKRYFFNVRTDSGEVVNVSRGRYVLLAHISPEPGSGRYTVNHIDGDESNDKLTNLEWLSLQENIQHSYDIGLRKHQQQEVDAWDIIANKTIRFPSVNELIRVLKVPNATIRKRLNASNSIVYNGRWRYKRAEDDWLALETKEERNKRFRPKTTVKAVKALNVLTGEITYFEAAADAARSIGLDSKDLNSHIRFKQNACTFGFLFRNSNDEFPEISEDFKNLVKTLGADCRIISGWKLSKGNEVKYFNITDAAKFLNTTESTVRMYYNRGLLRDGWKVELISIK